MLIFATAGSLLFAVTQSALWHLQEDDLETVRSTVLSLALTCLEPAPERSAERAGQA